MPISAKDAGIIKTITEAFANVAGIWKPTTPYARDAGIWKPTLNAVTFEYVGRGTGTGGEPYSMASVSFGAAFAGRILLIYVTASVSNTGRAVSSVTVAGAAATQIVGMVSESSGGASTYSTVWAIADAVNTSGTVVVDWDGLMGGNEIAVVALKNAAGIGPANFATEISGALSFGSRSVAAGGAIIGFGASSGDGANTWSWAGLGELYDAPSGVGSWTMTVAGQGSLIAQNINITATPTGSGLKTSGIVLSYNAA